MSQVTDEIVEVACRAHAPQWDGIDDGIKVYARDQMRAAIEAILPLIDPASGGEGKVVAWMVVNSNADDAVIGLYRNEGIADAQINARPGGFEYRKIGLSALTLPPASDSEKLIEAAYRQGIEDAAKLCDVMAKTKAMSGPKSTIIASAMSHAGEDLASSIRALERPSNG